MSRDFENIVRDSFEHFEADVNPQVWANVQQGLQQVPVPTNQAPDSSLLQAGAKATGILGKYTAAILAVSTAAVITSAGIWYYLKTVQQEERVSAPNQVIVSPEGIQEKTTSPFGSENNSTKAGSEVITPDRRTEKKAVTAGDNNKQADIRASHHTNRSPENNKPLADTKEQNQQALTTKADSKRAESLVNPSTANTKPANQASQDKIVTELIQSYQSEPIAYIIANPVVGNAPLTVSFLNNGYAKTVTWDFAGDVMANQKSEINYTFATPGRYTVRLLATDQNGREFSDEVEILVKGDQITQVSSVAEIQNVFTPNGDGYNDVFRVKGNNLSSLSAVIFNASGKNIYRWTNPEEGWDGKTRGGEMAPEGTYYYIIEATGRDGKVYSFKGAIRLIK